MTDNDMQWATARLADCRNGMELLEELGRIGTDGARAIVVDARDGEDISISPEQLRTLERFPLPLVFAGEGQAVRGGLLAVAVSCDIRVCDSESTWSLGGSEPDRLRQLVGDGLALRLLRSGEVFDAEAALECGLVSGVTARGQAAAEGERLAGVIASRGPIATRLGKEAVWFGLEMPLEQALRFELDLTLLLQTTKDRAEGVRAFLEKRTPNFAGE